MTDPDLRRFVILEHDHPFLHWDLLLEEDAALLSWRLLHPVATGQWIPAERLPDHRLVYLTYEGPVSEGRGTVTRLADGEFATLPSDNSHDDAQHYRFYNCPLAHAATCRPAHSSRAEWYFE